MQEYGHKTPNELGMGSGPVWWQGRIWLLSLWVRAVSSRERWGLWGSSVPGKRLTPAPQGCTGAQAQGWGLWAARGKLIGSPAHGGQFHYSRVRATLVPAGVASGGKASRKGPGPERPARSLLRSAAASDHSPALTPRTRCSWAHICADRSQLRRRVVAEALGAVREAAGFGVLR